MRYSNGSGNYPIGDRLSSPHLSKKGEKEMAIVEQMELVRHRSDIIADVRKVFEQYRAIFDSEVPRIDRNAADTHILREMRSAVVDLEKELFG